MSLRAKWPAAAAMAVCLLSAAVPSNAAGVSVPYMELVTRGAQSGSVFGLSTRGSLDLAVEGGYKFGGSVLLGYTNAILEPSASFTSLDFKGLSIVIRELAGLPLSLSFFVGDNDILCNGDDFSTVFGSRPIATRYRGFLTFPTGIAGQPNEAYDGIHQVKGTGLRLDLLPPGTQLQFSLYGYQDSHFVTDPALSTSPLEPGYYSGDLRVLAGLGPVKIEGFLGATYSPIAALGYYRGGLLFHAAGPGVEFLAQIGVPKYDPVSDPVSINLLYVLFEPRLHLGLFSVVPTFFWHPGYYLQQPTNELGSFDVNLDMYLGDLATTSVQGGLEGTLRFASITSTFNVTASPYLSFITPGILWNFKLDVQLRWPFAFDAVSGLVGVRAEF
jgi:hypothetical protein